MVDDVANGGVTLVGAEAGEHGLEPGGDEPGQADPGAHVAFAGDEPGLDEPQGHAEHGDRVAGGLGQGGGVGDLVDGLHVPGRGRERPDRAGGGVLGSQSAGDVLRVDGEHLVHLGLSGDGGGERPAEHHLPGALGVAVFDVDAGRAAQLEHGPGQVDVEALADLLQVGVAQLPGGGDPHGLEVGADAPADTPAVLDGD